ncbi:hypothetical protein N9Y37_10450 [Luminiphilus sp.]|nr:hypothetical protein [Luminiphilus sp.]
MINAVTARWRGWPRLLQRSVAGLLAAALMALLYLTLAGSPQPISPAQSLFAPVSVEQALLASRPELSSFDFIFRPVFALKRVPPVMPALADQQDSSVDESPLDEVVEGIDGVSLLGIFGSGEVAGVIIRLDNGVRKRLPVGEAVKGWTLKSLGSRRAMLSAATGQQAVLEMAFATDQTPLDISTGVTEKAVVPSSNTAEAESVQQLSTAEKADSAPDSISFDSVYRSRYKTTPDE